MSGKESVNRFFAHNITPGVGVKVVDLVNGSGSRLRPSKHASMWRIVIVAGVTSVVRMTTEDYKDGSPVEIDAILNDGNPITANVVSVFDFPVTAELQYDLEFDANQILPTSVLIQEIQT